MARFSIPTSGAGYEEIIPLPSFLTYVEGRDALPTLNSNFGWDSSGLWFGPTSVDSPSDASYPVFTNFTIPQNSSMSVSFDFVIPENTLCSDIGMAIYVDGDVPNWTWGTDLSRIAAQFNCPNPELNGRNTQGNVGEEDLSIPSPGTYRFSFYYNPNAETENVVFSYSSSGIDAAVVSIDEVLPEGNYRIGFASDNDGPDGEGPSGDPRSYIRNLEIMVNPGGEGQTIYSDSLTSGSSVPVPVTSLGDIKTRNWAYPTPGAIAIMPTTDGEAISLKSSDSSAIRWHVRDNGSSASGSGQLLPTSAEVVTGDSVYLVTFTFPEENSVPTTTEHVYSVTAPNSVGFEGTFLPIDATTTTITFEYQVDPGVFDPQGSYINQPSVYSQFEVDETGAHVKVANWTDGQGASYSHTWDFTNEGAIHFPYGPSNSRTGSGDVLRFASSSDQAIITGPVATEVAPTAPRLVVAGQDGYVGTTGEGGDLYLWAGIGGSNGGSGGDVKVDAGNGGGNDGYGGTVKVRGGYSTNNAGGYVLIEGGNSSNGAGGNVDINAGDNYVDMEQYGGSVNIAAGSSGNAMGGGSIALSTSQAGSINLNADGKVLLNGQSGEFLNDAGVANNQIATVGDIATAVSAETSFTVNGGTLGTAPTFDGDPLFSGSYVKTGAAVHFQIQVLFTNITSFGTGQYYVDLPFPAKYGYQIRNGCIHDTSNGNQWAITGHVLAGESTMKLFYSAGSGQDEVFDYNSPFVLQTVDKFHISGDYIVA